MARQMRDQRGPGLPDQRRRAGRAAGRSLAPRAGRAEPAACPGGAGNFLGRRRRRRGLSFRRDRRRGRPYRRRGGVFRCGYCPGGPRARVVAAGVSRPQRCLSFLRAAGCAAENGADAYERLRSPRGGCAEQSKFPATERTFGIVREEIRPSRGSSCDESRRRYCGLRSPVRRVSPVRMRTTSVRSETKILPSPTWPVRATSQIVSITPAASSVATTTSSLILGMKSTTYSAPRYISAWPFCRPKPETSVTVMPLIPRRFKASLTSSSLKWRMMASIFFMGNVGCGVQWRRCWQGDSAFRI